MSFRCQNNLLIMPTATTDIRVNDRLQSL